MDGTTYTISARNKPFGLPVMVFLKLYFNHIPLHQIDSLFGFLEYCPLYGGRDFNGRQIDDQDVESLRANHIGVRIPLTNHFVNMGDYEKTRPLLEKYHRKGNSVIATRDTLAKWIRRDYPEYQLEASVIKDLHTKKKIDAALDLYDTAVLPMSLSPDYDFLDTLDNKHRITLFANAGCAFNCPSKICYPIISRINKSPEMRSLPASTCSKATMPRPELGVVDFDLRKLSSLGFRRFKVLRPGNNVSGF